jgi:probable rRNA maturation factor
MTRDTTARIEAARRNRAPLAATAARAEQTASPSSTLTVDIVCEAGIWDTAPDADAVIRAALSACEEQIAAHLRPAAVAVALIDDAHMRRLNRDFRGIDTPTNVLSFPAPMMPGMEHPLGDLAIALETTVREAAESHKSFAHHLSHLAVHGFLHLLGHDHETEAEADAMERLERAILAPLQIPDPYAAPDRED